MSHSRIGITVVTITVLVIILVGLFFLVVVATLFSCLTGPSLSLFFFALLAEELFDLLGIHGVLVLLAHQRQLSLFPSPVLHQDLAFLFFPLLLDQQLLDLHVLGGVGPLPRCIVL